MNFREQKFRLAFAVLIFTSGCSTAEITLVTNPSQAGVYVAGLGERKSRLIGETPLRLTAEELSEIYGGTGPVSLEFKKDGYSPAKTIITDIEASDLTLNTDLTPTSGLEDLTKLNSILDSIFEGQRLAKVGRPDDALDRLKEVEKDAPQLAAIYEIEGGIYYLQKKYKQALDAYSLAASYNPKNPDTLRMKVYLQNALGVNPQPIPEPGPQDREPSSQSSPVAGVESSSESAGNGLSVEGGG